MMIKFNLLLALLCFAKHSAAWDYNRHTSCDENGDNEFLDRHAVACPGGQGLNGWGVHTCGDGKIQIHFKCSSYTGNEDVGITPMRNHDDMHCNVAGNEDLREMDRDNPEQCESKGVLTGFHWNHCYQGSRPHPHGWTYNCAEQPTSDCIDLTTSCNPSESVDLNFLDRHNLKCPADHEYLVGWQWKPCDHDVEGKKSHQMQFRCCNHVPMKNEDKTSEYGDMAAIWTLESMNPAQHWEKTTLEETWQRGKSMELTKQHTDEFTKTYKGEYKVKYCYEHTQSVVLMSTGFKFCASVFGSHSTEHSRKDLVGHTIQDTHQYGSKHTCTTSTPDFCKEHPDGCTLWRWSVARKHNPTGDTTTLRTCLVHYQPGEFRDQSPNCVPTKCDAEDPSCFTCSDRDAQFAPLFVKTSKFKVCPRETCRWHPVSKQDMPHISDVEIAGLPECSVWQKRAGEKGCIGKVCTGREDRLCKSKDALASSEKSETTIYRYSCSQRGFTGKERDAYYQSETPFCDGLEGIVNSKDECEDVAFSFGYDSVTVSNEANHPLGCFDKAGKAYYKGGQRLNGAMDLEARSFCRHKLLHLHGDVAEDSHRTRNCVDPSDYCSDVYVEHPDKYIAGYPSGVSSKCSDQENCSFDEARTECERVGKNCKGIVRNHLGGFSCRAGSDIQASAIGETAFVKPDCGGCDWTEGSTGSVLDHNIACYSGKTLDQCKQMCAENSDCLSIDYKAAADGHFIGQCCLGNCRMGDGECVNDNDQNYKYYECRAGYEFNKRCPLESFIQSPEECMYAASQLYQTFDNQIQEVHVRGMPSGCSIRQDGAPSTRLVFNHYATTLHHNGAAGSRRICRGKTVSESWSDKWQGYRRRLLRKY